MEWEKRKHRPVDCILENFRMIIIMGKDNEKIKMNYILECSNTVSAPVTVTDQPLIRPTTANGKTINSTAKVSSSLTIQNTKEFLTMD